MKRKSFKAPIIFNTDKTLENIHLYIASDTHKPMDKPLGKLVYDAKRKLVAEKSVENIVSGSFLNYGGYGARDGYRPTSQKIYKLVLSGKEKKIETVGFYV